MLDRGGILSCVRDLVNSFLANGDSQDFSVLSLQQCNVNNFALANARTFDFWLGSFFYLFTLVR